MSSRAANNFSIQVHSIRCFAVSGILSRLNFALRIRVFDRDFSVRRIARRDVAVWDGIDVTAAK